jgi:phage gp29-like protein
MSTYHDKWARLGVQFAEAAPAAPMIDAEFAGGDEGRDITRGYVGGLELLTPEDPILQTKGGGNLTLYETLYSHPDVKIAMEQRVLGLLGKEWYVEPGGSMRRDKMAADLVREALQTLGFESDEGTHAMQAGWDSATAKMQTAGVFFGYGVAEIFPAIDGNTITLEKIKVKKSRRFGYGPDGRLKLLTTRQPQGEPVPPRKFWQLACGAIDDDEPYGLGLGHWLYWPVWFLRNGHKFWSVYLEGLAKPPVMGKHPPNAGEPEKKKLLAALRAVHQNGRIAISDNMLIELLEATRSSSGDYQAFATHWQALIYRLILGQDFSVTGAGGQYKGDNLMAVQGAVIKADSDLVNISFSRGPAAWLTDWNYPGAAVPRVWRRCEDAPDLSALADRDAKVFTFGYRPTLKQVTETYGGEWEAVGPAAPPPSPPANGSQGDQGTASFAEGGAPAALEGPDLADEMTERLGLEAEPLIERDFLDPIRAAMAEGGSLADFGERLPELFDRMDTRGLAELAALGFVAAELGGRYELREGQ